MELKAKLRRLAGTGTAVAFAATLLTAAGLGTGTAAAAEEDIYLVLNGNTGRCLTANNLQEIRNEVSTRDCVSGAATQKWRIVGGHFIPQGSARPARCLDTRDPQVFTWHCDDDTSQDWRTNGSPTWIRNVAYPGMCLHSSGDPNAPVTLNPCGAESSRWVTRKV